MPAYQNIGPKAYKADLSNIEALSEYLGNPDRQFKSIHVAGTNGKGSVSHMMASVLQEAGYKVGLYTSPHLKDFRERIKINGATVTKDVVTAFVEQHKTYFEAHALSFFEMTVGLAFEVFAQQKVDVAIIEVGLGGRLDSTNIIRPELSVITNIGLDHTQFLGDTLEKIAREKAGIIKKGIPVVIGQKQDKTTNVFLEIAQKVQAPIIFAEDMDFPTCTTDLKGDYQNKNKHTALAALQLLAQANWNIALKEVVSGLEKVVINTGLQGRWQILGENPTIIADTAHNKDGLIEVLKQLNALHKNKLHIVLGTVNDKDLDSILDFFPKKAHYYFCRPNVLRGLEAQILQERAVSFDLQGEVFTTVNQAFEAAKQKANPDDVIFVGGSTFVVAEIL